MPRSPIPPAEHRCSTLERNTHVLAGAPLHFALTQALAPTPSSLRQQEHIVCRQVSCASLARLPKPPQRAQEPTSFNCSGGHFGHRESPPAPGKRCRALASSQLVNTDPQIGPQTLPAGSPWFGWSLRVPNAGEQHLFAAFNAV